MAHLPEPIDAVLESLRLWPSLPSAKAGKGSRVIGDTVTLPGLILLLRYVIGSVNLMAKGVEVGCDRSMSTSFRVAYVCILHLMW